MHAENTLMWTMLKRLETGSKKEIALLLKNPAKVYRLGWVMYLWISVRFLFYNGYSRRGQY